MIEKEIMTTTEAARYLSVNPETLRRWHRTGKLKAIQIVKNGRFHYRKEELDALLKASR